MGYSFSIIHALAYGFIALQTLYLATNFNPIYWNTSYLIVNSGSVDEENSEQTDYTKLAKAIGEIRNAGIEVSLVDINKSDFGFQPDVANNQILFGLKGLANVNNDLIKTIIDNRPYVSLVDFMNKVHPNKQAMLSLVKGGGFDHFSSRAETMIEYIWLTCDKKKRLTLQNLPGLMRYNMIPDDEKFEMPKRIYEFNRYLKSECKDARKLGVYLLDSRAINFLNEIEKDDLMFMDNFSWYIDVKAWDKVYQSYMDVFREWIAADKERILDDLNTAIFMQDWNKYAKGNISSWEMEALCFYYHDHELKNVNNSKYGLVNFIDLPETPIVDKVFKKGNATIPIFKLFKICGTCIAKNKTKGKAYLLTTSGVVTVMFRREYFALFDRQVFKKNPDGTKTVLEKSWFNRGNMIMVQGIRRGDEFVAKNYKSSGGHQLYHIDEVLDNGDLILRSDRRQGDGEEEDEV